LFLTLRLQQKLKIYKRQLDETEEIAALNLAKYRKAQTDYEDAAERADSAENQLEKLRAKNRSSVSVSRATPQREGRESTRQPSMSRQR